MIRNRTLSFAACVAIGAALTAPHVLQQLTSRLQGAAPGAAAPTTFSKPQLGMLRDECVAGATESARKANPGGLDRALQTRVDRYCHCFVDGVHNEYTPVEFESLGKQAGLMEKDLKLNRLVDRCAIEAGKT